jgi:hypothetical protein
MCSKAVKDQSHRVRAETRVLYKIEVLNVCSCLSVIQQGRDALFGLIDVL